MSYESYQAPLHQRTCTCIELALDPQNNPTCGLWSMPELRVYEFGHSQCKGTWVTSKLHLYDLLWICCSVVANHRPVHRRRCASDFINFLTTVIAPQIMMYSWNVGQSKRRTVPQVHNKAYKWSECFGAQRFDTTPWISYSLISI